MILIKKYKGKDEKEFETTLEDELINLAKTFINTDLIVEILKKGKMVSTPWATFIKKGEKNERA